MRCLRSRVADVFYLIHVDHLKDRSSLQSSDCVTYHCYIVQYLGVFIEAQSTSSVRGANAFTMTSSASVPSSSPSIQIPAVVFCVVSPLIVAIRFWSRLRTSAKLGVDDWVILLSLVRVATNSGR